MPYEVRHKIHDVWELQHTRLQCSLPDLQLQEIDSLFGSDQLGEVAVMVVAVELKNILDI